ncbi:MAG: hypothetical protein HFH41_00900 [Lachnospiraceae bacterium]|nr:hypothetical protein [Lachnospiraceae bacterium]
MDNRMEELLPLVAELAQKYTGYESTSVTYERAQTLMESVLYCLEEYENSAGNHLVFGKVSVREQYEIGKREALKKAEHVRDMFNDLSLDFEDFGVQCLYDTVQKGIPEFLKWYDAQFCAQDRILTLDYPLLTDCSSWKGADGICRYLSAIQMEQEFLGMFDQGYVRMVLEKYDPEYQMMLENICGIILNNMLGHIAIQKPLDDLGFREEEYLQLSQVFGGKSISEIEEIEKYFIQKLVKEFYQDDETILEYLCCNIKNTAVRIDLAIQQNQLGKIFLL